MTDIRKAVNQELILGTGRFREDVAQVLGRRVDVQKPGRKKVRDQAAWLASNLDSSSNNI